MTRDEAISRAFKTALQLDLEGLTPIQTLRVVSKYATILQEVDDEARAEQAKQHKEEAPHIDWTGPTTENRIHTTS